MADTLLFALPEKPARDRRDTHWWHVVDGELVSEGQGDEWLNFAGPRRNLIGIAPAAQVRLSFSEKVSATTTDRQAEAVARVAAVNSSLGEDKTLHSVSGVSDDGTIMTAVTEKVAMTAWLDIPLTRALAASALVMAASLLTPVKPVDGGASASAGGAAAGLTGLGLAVLLVLGLV